MESETKAEADANIDNKSTQEDGVTGNEEKADAVPSREEDENSNKEIHHMTEDGRDKNRKQDSFDYGMSLLQDSIYFDSEIQVRPELVESLTTGFTQKFLPSLERNRKTIDQIKSSQEVLIETVQQENNKFEECQANGELDTTMTKARVYHAKLIRLRKEMTSLYEKSAKLKRRALRLQQQKQKDELTRAQQMEAQYEKEKMLTARVAPPSSPEKET